MNETNTPDISESKIIKGSEDTFLIPTGSDNERPVSGIPLPEVNEASSDIQHDTTRLAFSSEEIAAHSLLTKGSGLNYEIHAEAPHHIPVLAKDDTEEIPVVTHAPEDTSVANPRRVSFLHPDSRQIPKKYQ